MSTHSSRTYLGTICGPGHPDPAAALHIHYEPFERNQPVPGEPFLLRTVWRCLECGATWHDDSPYASFEMPS